MRRVRRLLLDSKKSFNLGGDRGVAIIEFAMVLPLLVLLLVIIINLGLVIHEHQVLQNAAREGARFSALPRNQIDAVNPAATQAEIKQRVVAYCEREDIIVPVENIVLNQQRPISVDGLTVMASEVTITYARDFLIPGAPFLPVGAVTLAANSVFRNLY